MPLYYVNINNTKHKNKGEELIRFIDNHKIQYVNQEKDRVALFWIIVTYSKIQQPG